MTIDNVSGGELIDPAWGNSVADEINSRGVKGRAKVTTTQSAIGTGGAILTGLTVTFNAEANRRYKITVGVNPANAAGATEGIVTLNRGGFGTISAGGVVLRGGGNYTTLTLIAEESFVGAGSVTYTVTMLSNAGTVNSIGSATVPAIMIVEDIGAA